MAKPAVVSPPPPPSPLHPHRSPLNSPPLPNPMADDLDPSLLLTLITLLDPSSTTLSLPSIPPPQPPTSSSSSSAPLLLFALATALTSASIPTLEPIPPLPSHPSLASLLSLPPSLRSARCRLLFGLPFPSFSSLLSLLLPFSSSLPLPLPLSLPIALSRLSRSPHLPPLPLPPPLVSRSFHSITRLLAISLYSHFLPHSDPYNSHLPNLLGAIACSPVRLRLAAEGSKLDSEFYSPARPFPSVLLQVVADGRRVFSDACVLAPGAADPASHFRASRLCRRLLAGEEESVVTVRGQNVRAYLAGDASFPLLPCLLTPFAPLPATNPERNPAHEVFDAALARARAESVEPAVALLKGRWKILRSLDVGPEHAAQTVIACVVLHNICQLAGEPEDEGRYYWRDPPEATPQPARPLESERSLYYAGESVRQALADDLYDRQYQHLGGAR